jgi:hypothetical protein
MLGKRIVSSFLRCTAAITLAFGCLPNTSFGAVKQDHIPAIRPSNILGVVNTKMKKQPKIVPKELAAYANKLLEEKGFDYHFDVCGVLETRKRTRGISSTLGRIQSYTMTQTNGKKIRFKLAVEGSEEALCGECWSQIPSLQVTRKQMLVVSGNRRYRLKRPAAFVLDEAALVDGTMTNVLRTWQLPYQSVPVGISPDGTKLYMEFYVEHELDALFLELSEDGRVRFKARNEVDLRSKGEWIEVFPKDPTNAYLSYMRFHTAGNSHIIKFTAPCT